MAVALLNKSTLLLLLMVAFSGVVQAQPEKNQPFLDVSSSFEIAITDSGLYSATGIIQRREEPGFQKIRLPVNVASRGGRLG